NRADELKANPRQSSSGTSARRPGPICAFGCRARPIRTRTPLAMADLDDGSETPRPRPWIAVRYCGYPSYREGVARRQRPELVPGHRRGAARISEVEPALLRQRLERGLRPSADVLDHLGGGERTEPPAAAKIGTARQSNQEPGGEQIAGP